MQGIVYNQRGAYVDAAIIKIIKIKNSTGKADQAKELGEAVIEIEEPEAEVKTEEEVGSEGKTEAEAGAETEGKTGAETEGEAEVVTYTETDEKGRFVIWDLNPDEKYIIEIFVKETEAEPDQYEISKGSDVAQEDIGNEDEEFDYYTDSILSENFIVDSLAVKNAADSSYSQKVTINNLNNESVHDLNSKAYLTKNNLW